MKKTIRKMLAVVLSCVLFTGCGAAQKIDDYATNEGAQKTAQTAEKEEAKAKIKQVVEGVNCAQAAMALANRYHVSMPIVEQINAVLFEGKTTKQALKELLVRDRVSEYRTLSW